MTVVFKGQVYEWENIDFRVIRVARDGSWADIRCYQPETGVFWSKRQPLPLPNDAILTGVQFGGAR